MITVDVQKRFPSVQFNFSLQLRSNRIVIFGPSGSGKSTLLKLITGLCTPEQGQIAVGETVLFHTDLKINTPVHRRQLGYLPQDYPLFPHLNIKENILYGVQLRKAPLQEGQFREIVARCGLAEKLSAHPHELSGGQQQRAALARVMLIRPKVLLLDEPFSGLDSSVRESLQELVSDLADEEKIPALLVTHDLEETLAFGREIVIINEGRIVEYGKKDTIFQSPRYVTTALLLGFQVWPLLERKGTQLQTCGGETFRFSGHGEQNAQYICIRPENIMLIREDRAFSKEGGENIVSGVISNIHHRARYIRLVFESLRGEEYLIHTPEHVLRVMNIHEGKAVRISLKQESLVLCSNRPER